MLVVVLCGVEQKMAFVTGQTFECRDEFFCFQAEDGIRDRKSTRLNSSHLPISYAVFCLKKKKDQPIIGGLLAKRRERRFIELIIQDKVINAIMGSFSLQMKICNVWRNVCRW